MRILYISYDGLLDPLGQSQILPYLKGISCFAESIDIISFEKSLYEKDKISILKSELILKNIKWHPLKFTKKYGVFGKIWDLLKMNCFSLIISIKESTKVTHARGHVAALPAFLLKKIFFKNMIFDFRGLWVDERVDKGGWDLKIFSHKVQYNFFKFLEKLFLRSSDQIVVLTKKASNELTRLFNIDALKITVIPCCADFQHFSLQTDEKMRESRKKLGIPDDSFVFGCLGSMGEMYVTESALKLFIISCQSNHLSLKSPWLLMITKDISQAKKLILKCIPKNMQNRVILKSADREDIPHLIHAMNILISFITSTYARIAASPTKIGECFSAGVPVIVNSGIGDLDEYLMKLNAGLILDEFGEKNLEALLKKIEHFNFSKGKKLRDQAESIFSLDYANLQYKNVYSRINR
tara:strand:+ start:70 stop:1299 length:1230 start_codon:yes stop_codon:yes gene_type:complete